MACFCRDAEDEPAAGGWLTPAAGRIINYGHDAENCNRGRARAVEMNVRADQPGADREARGEREQPDDAVLAARVARGDRDAAAMLINRYQSAVRSFLRRLTGRDDLADDLAQETFLRLLRHARRYDPSYSMKTWLFTIARRLSLNHARRAGAAVAEMDGDRRTAGDPTPAQRAASRDGRDHLRKCLDAALAQVSEPQRLALVLVHQEGWSVEAAAQFMKMPPGTVKSHLYRGREAMRRVLGPQMEAVAP
jgi:RNA polymerase sigma-70 factor, ECF subfamily